MLRSSRIVRNFSFFLEEDSRKDLSIILLHRTCVSNKMNNDTGVFNTAIFAFLVNGLRRKERGTTLFYGLAEPRFRRTWRRRIGGSVRHNCVQVFNIISCFISDARKIFERRERREFGNTWSSIVHLARGYQNLLHLNAHYKFSRSVLRVSTNFSPVPSNKPPLEESL